MHADDSEAESEGEELRKAARAFAAANKHSKAEPDVIVLDDSSDEDVVAPPRQPAAAARHAWPANGIPAGPGRQGHQHQRPDSSRADTVPHRWALCRSTVTGAVGHEQHILRLHYRLFVGTAAVSTVWSVAALYSRF